MSTTLTPSAPAATPSTSVTVAVTTWPAYLIGMSRVNVLGHRGGVPVEARCTAVPCAGHALEYESCVQLPLSVASVLVAGEPDIYRVKGW